MSENKISESQEIITFGCRLNIYESEIIRQNLKLSGEDNIVVFNTCAVTKNAESEARSAIRKYKAENPDKKIIVTGCAAQSNPKQFLEMSEVDKILGNEEKLYHHNFKFTDGQERLLVNDIMSVKETASHMVSHFAEHSRAFIQVQNGCNHRCTFCIIPYGRGNSRSTPIGAIVQQVKLLVAKGYKEVVLTGVDVTSYGPDLPGQPTFSQMIKRLLAQVPELKRLRLSSIDVAEIDDELFNMMVNEERLMPYLHISLQAGDNMILKRMKRRHTREQVVEFCNNLRSLRNDISFGADIIAGFPTETDEMFLNTLNLIEEADLQYLHVFPYSEREGTPAARMPQVDKKIRKERAKILREKGEENLSKFFIKNNNIQGSILVEKDNFGHAENFIPVKFNTELAEGSLVNAILQYEKGKKFMIGRVIELKD